MAFLFKIPINFYFNLKNVTRSRKIAPELRHEKLYHRMSVEDLVKLLGLKAINQGLDSQMASQILQLHGPNIIPTSKSALYNSIARSFFKGFGPILWFACIFSILLYQPLGGSNADPANIVMGVFIFFILILQVGFAVLQDYSSTKAMKSILGLAANHAKVIRDGKKVRIPASELVVGDVVFLSSGGKVPADMRIIEAKHLELNNSMLTGECQPVKTSTLKYEAHQHVKYTDANNMAFMTSIVANGSGKGIVVATGQDTFITSIAHLTDSKHNMKETHLQKEINRFSLIIVIVSIITVLISIIFWFSWMKTYFPNYTSNTSILFANLISTILSYIPLGLPVSLTVVLWLDSRKMRKSQVIVKNLTALETLSSLNVIASDKTGTLTQNRMHVASIMCGMRKVDPESCFVDSVVYIGVDTALVKLLAICRLCNNADISRDYKKGNATDLALYQFSDTNLKYGKIKKSYILEYEKRFNSTDKYHMVVCRPKNLVIHEMLFGVKDYSKSHYMFVKGAPDVLINKCKFVIETDGNHVPLDQEMIQKLQDCQNAWSNMGRRVIMVCERMCTEDDIKCMKSAGSEYFKEKIDDLCIVGLLGLVDPPKEGIADTLAQCKQAGIRVIMVTGDYSGTAAAIASEIGIFAKGQDYDTFSSLRAAMRRKKRRNQNQTENSAKANQQQENSVKPANQFSGSILLSGRDLDEIDKDEWKQICNNYLEIVIARSTPQHKLKVINEFQENGYIIGMTGDGINDAPALKKANIGIAMGSGNSVAMEAADAILMDNSFTHIVYSIENGRLVYDNLKKLVCFFLPASVFCQIVSTLLNLVLGSPVILSSFQVLVIGFVTDLIPSLSFIYEKKEGDLLARKPRTSKEHLVSLALLFQGFVFVGCQMVFFQMLNFFIYLKWNGNINLTDFFLAFDSWKDGYLGYSQSQLDDFLSGAQTAGYLTIVTMQLFGSMFSLRTRKRSILTTFPLLKRSRNQRMFVLIIVSYLVLIGTVYIPGISSLCNTKAISYHFFLLPLAYALWLIVAEEIRKVLFRKKILPEHLAW